jgi:hypothetical protein
MQLPVPSQQTDEASQPGHVGQVVPVFKNQYETLSGSQSLDRAFQLVQAARGPAMVLRFLLALVTERGEQFSVDQAW